MAQELCGAVVLNECKLNFDSRLNFDALAAVASLRKFDDTTPDELLERVGSSAILVTKEMQVPATVIERLPASVRLICEAGTGYNNIDTEAARRCGIAVCNVPTYSTDAVAHLVITFVMNLSSSIGALQRKLEAADVGGWSSIGLLPHFELGGKTLGLVGGRGAIGSRVAAIAGALGMRVLVSSRSPAGEASAAAGVEIVDFATLLRESDFVSIHCPLSAATRHLIGATELATMKPTAYIINTARGPIIDEAALVEALRSGALAGAGLDVHEVEPLPANSPLIGMRNVLLTPHIGWQRLETRQRLVDTVADTVRAFLAGAPINVVS